MGSTINGRLHGQGTWIESDGIKYEIKMSVPSSQVSSPQKKFENLIHKAINTGQGMKQTKVHLNS